MTLVNKKVQNVAQHYIHESSTIWPRFINLCHSGEISPNLVALDSNVFFASLQATVFLSPVHCKSQIIKSLIGSDSLLLLLRPFTSSIERLSKDHYKTTENALQCFSLLLLKGNDGWKYIMKLGGGCGAVGRAVASKTKDLQFESSNWQIFITIICNEKVCWKDENKEKRDCERLV